VILFLLLVLVTEPDVIPLPSPLDGPRVTWEDLDGDGLDEIWVRHDGGLMVRPGGGDGSFLVLDFPDIGLATRPVWLDGTWCVRAYERGRMFLYHPAHGWSVYRDHTASADRIRPGLEPIPLEDGVLVPLFDAYLHRDGPCVVDRLEALPSMTLNEHRLQIRYPRPEPVELNGDGRTDLIAGPIDYPSRGELGIWYALREENGWREGVARVQLDADQEVRRHQFGDLNGDGFFEMAVLTMPASEVNIFDELTMLVYAGTGPGAFEPVPVQKLETRQKLWQVGPIEMMPGSMTVYYYKGLIGSRFTMDRYAWNPDGYLEPRPESERWKMKDAERETIVLDHDFDLDGHTDLVLIDDKGVFVYYRDPGSVTPFSRERGKPLIARDARRGNLEVSVEVAGRTIDVRIRDIAPGNRLKRQGEVALITAGNNRPPALWTLVETDEGECFLVRL